MENYRQDFGFYRSKEPISVIAGKILTALQHNPIDDPCISDIFQEQYDLETLQHMNVTANDGNTDMDFKKERMITEEETQDNRIGSEARSSDSFFAGSYHKSADTELPVKLQIRNDTDEDHLQPYTNKYRESERQRKQLLAPDKSVESLPFPLHGLEASSVEEPEMGFPEYKVKRKCADISDGRKLWNMRCMDEEQQCRLLDEAQQALAIVLTMLYQNGSSQLCSSKDDNNASMNGILVLLKKKSDLVCANEEIYHADNTYIHITITDDALLEEGQVQPNFLRTMLLLILQSTALVICFNAKDFLQTIYGKFMNYRNVMENCSIEINQDELKKTSVLLGIHLKRLEKEAHHAAGQKFRLTSSNELREILYEKFHLHLKCKSKLPQTSLGHVLSTAEPALNQLRDLHPLPEIILQFRQIQKIKSTFVDGLFTYVSKGCVSPTWNQTGTVSGRLSAKHPNIQGVSKFSVQFEKQQVQGKSKETITINPRSMFVSTKGYSFLAADFSQIELRLLAHFSADPALLKLFHETERSDVFTALASQWKDVEYESITQAEREQAKRVVYSVIYGIGKERLAECLGTTPAEANTFMECFLQKYRVSDFTQRVIQECHSKGFVISLMGRRRPLPHINSRNYTLRAQAERQAVNFVIQGSAADLCKLAMIKISASVTSSFYLTARLIAQIHDELLFEVQDSQLQEFAEVVKHIMESLQHADGVQLKVPLKVTLTSGKSWGCMTELHMT
ncbi:DNA polymerase nu isoform X2 [Dendropsophus ebraccatus]|uniref:DNA polymerase nu isoform X2 n=1 Tax=Dendropsophus ebraccatus TaxID=150705 RepID=UPI0038312BDB